MDYKPFLIKFFKKFSVLEKISQYEIIEWLLIETNYDICQAHIYSFVNAVGSFSIREKKVFTFNWVLIEKKFGVRKK